ncbi:MAG: hypothetical protein IPL59_26670 [Candidatus Competibacteraceae bacterium]|nr:hypothetical protein [Candidatus Competibacteraceae bacterium]
MRIAIRGGRLIDPAHGIDALLDLFIAGGESSVSAQRPDGFAANRRN